MEENQESTMEFTEWLALIVAYIIGWFAFTKVFGDASRLGRGEERKAPRKDPLDIDTDFV